MSARLYLRSGKTSTAGCRELGPYGLVKPAVSEMRINPTAFFLVNYLKYTKTKLTKIAQDIINTDTHFLFHNNFFNCICMSLEIVYLNETTHTAPDHKY